jgi:nifR3 family TIM-barrel protein
MEEITDQPFRMICKDYGADVLITEFVSSEGVIRNIDKSLRKLSFDESERPVGVQIFGNSADSLCEAARYAAQSRPDFIDLNFGCPVSKIVSKGCGSAMLKTPETMLEITSAVCKAVDVPVTVKTRLGWDDKSRIIAELAEKLQDCGIAMLSIHGRTRSQMYSGKADWTLIGEVASNPRIHIPVVGNGDIDSPFKAAELRDRYGVDGLMIGRATIGNPWIFRDIRHYFNTGNILMPPGIAERAAVCMRHLEAAVEWKGEKRAVIEMRKHYSGYFKGLPNFKPWRVKLLALTTLDEALDLLRRIPQEYAS